MSKKPSEPEAEPRRVWLAEVIQAWGGMSAVSEALRLPLSHLHEMNEGLRPIDDTLATRLEATFGPAPGGAAPEPVPELGARELLLSLVEMLKPLDQPDRLIASALVHLLATNPECAPRIGSLLNYLVQERPPN